MLDADVLSVCCQGAEPESGDSKQAGRVKGLEVH
jgi:hypothetical protein